MATEDEDNEITFSGDYVKELRTENASWRHKVRDLENRLLYRDIEVEFAKHGIEADPTILNIPDGMTAKEVVDKFAAFFPVNETDTTVPPVEPARPNYPGAIVPNGTKANAPGPPAQGAFGGRTLKEIEADPKAREQVRSWYREQLRGSSYGSEESIFTS